MDFFNRRLKLRRTKFLTGRQRAIFDFVRQKIYEGLPPTYYEIGDHFGFSVKAAFDHLKAIARKGYIRLEPGKPRAITLLPPYKDDTRHVFVVKMDVPELDIQKGDCLLIDTGKPIAEGEVILSVEGEIKRFSARDTAFGKVMSISREVD